MSDEGEVASPLHGATHEVSLEDHDPDHDAPTSTHNIAQQLEEDLGDDLNGEEEPPVSAKLRLEPSAIPQEDVSTAEEPMVGDMEVRIARFDKRGDGINAYIVYLVITTVRGVAGYTKDRYEVWRRFSDFLGIHERLAEKMLSRGIILPQPPEKSIVALTKTKTSETTGVNDVAKMRTRLLERYLGRLAGHPCIRGDCDLRDFLTLDVDLPKAFTKMALHMEEGDRWFEQAQSQTDEHEDATRRMHVLAEGLASTRKELASMGEAFSKSISLLASCEESTALARCLSHLVEAEEKAASLWDNHADVADTQELAESLGEYVALFNSLRNAFAERHRVWHNWQTAQQNITKKREQKTRLELAGKTEKAAALRAETEEAVQKADQLEASFGRISQEIRKEVARFDATRKKDMKEMIIKFLESLLATHTHMLKVWQRFAPETQAMMT